MLIIGSEEYINKNVQLITNGKEIEFNNYDKPYIKSSNIFFNKSHTKGLSALIVENVRCGIDIEKRRIFNEIMAKKFCSIQELNYLERTEDKDFYFTLFWVLKEAYLKCVGTGIILPLNNISFVKNNAIFSKFEGFDFKIVKQNEYLIAICKEVK